MTVQEYIKMIEVECGEKIDARTAKVMMSRDAEVEAIRRENGAYDVDPEIEEARRVADILAKPVQLYACYIKYCPHTDAINGTGKHLCAGFNSHDEAEAYVASEVAKGHWKEGDDSWPEIYPKRVLPVENVEDSGDCPF